MGGLKLVDIELKDKTLKISWAQRVLDPNKNLKFSAYKLFPIQCEKL